MSSKLKPKMNAAIIATIANSTSALTAAESIWASTYSSIDIGAMNMLLKLCDQTFHSAPRDIEYCVTRMISHISVPIYRYWAMVGFITDERNLVTKPKTTTVVSDQKGRSTSTSTDLAVMNTSWSRTAQMRSPETASQGGRTGSVVPSGDRPTSASPRRATPSPVV